METQELAQNLTGLFEKWNSGQDSVGQVGALNGAIEFAAKNGIELSLVIPKGLLDSKAVVKPILRGDAIEHSSGTGDRTVVFDIPSEAGIHKIGVSKRLSLKAVDGYMGLKNPILLKHETKGVVGVFIPGEITSLGVK